MVGMSAFLFDPHPLPLYPNGRAAFQGEGRKGEEMNTQTESKPSEAGIMIENPMQERYCGEVTESVEITAEAAFTARRLEAREEAGPVFVP
jgi:hypothetical protein